MGYFAQNTEILGFHNNYIFFPVLLLEVKDEKLLQKFLKEENLKEIEEDILKTAIDLLNSRKKQEIQKLKLIHPERFDLIFLTKLNRARIKTDRQRENFFSTYVFDLEIYKDKSFIKIGKKDNYVKWERVIEIPDWLKRPIGIDMLYVLYAYKRIVKNPFKLSRVEYIEIPKFVNELKIGEDLEIQKNKGKSLIKIDIGLVDVYLLPYIPERR